MNEGSKVPIPRDWPNLGETNLEYRKRIWAKHLHRISEKSASGGNGQQLDFARWEIIYSTEVDKNYELNKNRKKLIEPAAENVKNNKRNKNRNAKSNFTESETPRELKLGCGLLLLLFVGGCGGLALLGGLTATSPEKIMSMPNVIGEGFQEVNELLSANCAEIECTYSDLVEDRSIWNSGNWIIADQFPRAGADLTKVNQICFGVRKVDETQSQHKYVLSDACSSSELAFQKDQSIAWAQGYKDFGNGFAGGIEKHEACSFEGRKGFCAYGTVVSRDGTTAGSVIKVQWGRRSDPTIEGSPFLVSEVSIFSTSGGVSPGSKFTFTAFIPNNKSWYWTLDAVLYEVS